MRRDELIPVIVFEQNPDTPVRELIDGDSKANRKKHFMTDTGSDESPN